jgi:membrane-associated phospholipid phosphatase
MQTLDREIIIIQWIQSLGAWFTPWANFFSFLGSEQFFLLLAPAIYWCFDPILGIRIGIFLSVTSGLNVALKAFFHSPRPYWFSEAIQAITVDSSFGRPSAHAQISVVVWGTLAFYVRRKWAWISAVLLILFIGFSRVYLGVHFLSDVFLGWIISLILLWLLSGLEGPFLEWFKDLNISIQVLFIVLASWGVIALVILIINSVGEDAVLQSWIETAALAAPEADPIDPRSIKNIVSYSGGFLGMATGAVWINKRGWFNVRGTIDQLALRFLIGLGGVMILWTGLGSILPDGQEVIPLILRYFRYALTGFWIIGLAPVIFEKLKLTETRK